MKSITIKCVVHLQLESTGIESAIAALRKELATASGELRQYKEEQLAQIQRLSAAVKTAPADIEGLETAAKELTALQSEIKSLETTLQNERKVYGTELKKLEKGLRARITALEKKFASMTPPTSSAAPPPPPAAPASAPSSQPTPPVAPGQIVEQDIQ